MRKILMKLVSVLFCLVFVIGGASCDLFKEEQNENSTPTQQSNVFLISGFESKAELLSMVFSNIFGKVELTEDSTYVTEGKTAAKLTAYGKRNYGAEYYSDDVFYIKTGTQYLKKVDFTDTIKYSFDVYNPQDFSFRIAFGLNALAHANEHICGFETLEPGMNHLEFSIDRAATALYLNLESFRGFSFLMEHSAFAIDDEIPMVLYFDNFRGETTMENYEKPVTGSSIDFTESSDIARFATWGAPSTVFKRPTFKWNKSPEYVLTGRRSMEMTFYRNRTDTGMEGVGFRTKDNVIIGWNDFKGENANVSFAMYNPNDVKVTVGFTFYTPLNESYTKSVEIMPHSWVDNEQTSVLLSLLNEKFLGEGLDIYTVCFSVTGLNRDSMKLYLDNIKISE